jgi:hypothetical protein
VAIPNFEKNNIWERLYIRKKLPKVGCEDIGRCPGQRSPLFHLGGVGISPPTPFQFIKKPYELDGAVKVRKIETKITT